MFQGAPQEIGGLTILQARGSMWNRIVLMLPGHYIYKRYAYTEPLMM